MKKLLVSIVVLVVGISSFFYFSKTKENDDLGEVTIIVINELDETVYNQVISFEKDDTLFGLLDENIDVKCANASYQISDNCSKINANGRVILGLGVVETDWLNSFIAIYVDGVYSEYGIDGIVLVDDAEYRFEYTEVGGDN